MRRSLEAEKVFAVVGGGRWARVYLSVLSSLNLPWQLIVVSKSNVDRLAGLQDGNGETVRVIPTVEHLLHNYNVEAAVVVNAARLHDETALRLVDAGASVLIEKPFALHGDNVKRLYVTALENGVHVMPALTFMHCSYLQRFAETIRQIGEQAVRVRLEWYEPNNETRYGENKSYDSGVSIAQDIMPHIWAVITSILKEPKALVELQSCTIERGGRQASFEMFFSGIFCQIMIEREANTRRRFLVVELASGLELALDFTVEPGTLHVGSHLSSGDPDWDRSIKPVRRQLEAFFSLIKQPLGEQASQQASAASVSLVEESDALLKQQQKLWLCNSPISINDEDMVYAISELAAQHLYETAKICPGDRMAHRQWILTNKWQLRSVICQTS